LAHDYDKARNMSRSDIDTLIAVELPKMPGWCTPEKGQRLAALALGANVCVELGVFGGRSLVAIAMMLQDQGFGRVYGIDPFTASAALEGKNDPANDEWWAALDYETIAREAQLSCYRLRLTPYAQLVRMRSLDVVEFYENSTVDLLHQDSNHSEEISCQEVALWAPKIRHGGYWVFDDTNWPSTQKAQHELEALGFGLLEDHESWRVYRRGFLPTPNTPGT
jgi:methyltransferase family protein